MKQSDIEIYKETMSIKEVSEALRVNERTIQRYAKTFFPETVVHGRPTTLSEFHVTKIKIELQKAKNIGTVSELPKTDLEKELIIQQALNFQAEKINKLEAKNKLLNSELKEAQPKIDFHDKLIKSDGLYSMGEAAKILGSGRTKFFDQLRNDKIFFGREPYQSFIDRGYFELKTTVKNDHVQKQAFITPTGLSWIKKKFYSDGYQTNF